MSPTSCGPYFGATSSRMAVAAARSMYESIASFHDFSTNICKLLDDANFKAATELLMDRAFATRLPEHLEAALLGWDV